MQRARRVVFLVFLLDYVVGVGGTISLELRGRGNAIMVRSHLSGSMSPDARNTSMAELAPSNSAAGVSSASVRGHSAFPLIDMQKHPRLAALGRRAGGLALIFVSMCLSSIGFVMQRKAHLLDEQQGSEHKERSHRQRPLWLLGVALYILAALPDVVAYTLIPQMLCSAVGCFRFVLVSVLGHFLLAERLGRQEVTGIVVCTLGALLCVGFGPGDESIPLYPGEVHGKKVTHYVCSGLVVLAAFLVVVHTNLLGPNSKLQVFSLPFTTALAYGLEKVFNSELTFVPKPEKVLQDDPMWLKLVVAVAFFGILDFYLNLRAAQRMPLHVYMPLSFAFGTLIQNYQGLFVFDEIKDMRVYHSALTIVGAASALAGALMIQPPQFNQVDKGSKEKSAGISEVVAEPL